MPDLKKIWGFEPTRDPQIFDICLSSGRARRPTDEHSKSGFRCFVCLEQNPAWRSSLPLESLFDKGSGFQTRKKFRRKPGPFYLGFACASAAGKLSQVRAQLGHTTSP